MENNLPQLCASCRKLKEPNLGRRVKKRGREHDSSWICFHCLDKPAKLTCSRARSPLELEARRAVMDSGYRFQEEFQLGPFRYDIAVPALRLLVEIDSSKWHSHPSRVSRDRRKTRLAKAEGWELSRVNSKKAETIGFLVKQAVLRREAELSTDLDR